MTAEKQAEEIARAWLDEAKKNGIDDAMQSGLEGEILAALRYAQDYAKAVAPVHAAKSDEQTHALVAHVQKIIDAQAEADAKAAAAAKAIAAEALAHVGHNLAAFEGQKP